MAQDKTDKSCGQTVLTHAESIAVSAAVLGGNGYGCPESYRGYVAVAEFMRRLGKHDPVFANDPEIEATVVAMLDNYNQALNQAQARESVAASTARAERGIDTTSDPRDYRNRN